MTVGLGCEVGDGRIARDRLGCFARGLQLRAGQNLPDFQNVRPRAGETIHT